MNTMLGVTVEQWRSHIGRSPFRVRHALVENSLLSAEALAHLTERLPAEAVEHNLGTLPALHYAAPQEKSRAAPAEILRTPGFLGSWLAIKNVERVGEYRRLLLDCLAGVPDLHCADDTPHNQQGFIFASAHRSITPTHYDSEQNFLLQVRGTKAITIGGWPDSATAQREMELKQRGGHRYLPFLPTDPHTFHLEPGDGVYVPPNAPHFVEVFDEPSISFSATFRTKRTDAFDNCVVFNDALRRLGLDLRPPGSNHAVDRMKSLGVRMWRRTMQSRPMQSRPLTSRR